MDEITLTLGAPDVMLALLPIPAENGWWAMSENTGTHIAGLHAEEGKRVLTLEGDVVAVGGWAPGFTAGDPFLLVAIDYVNADERDAGTVVIRGGHVVADSTYPYMAAVLGWCLAADEENIRGWMDDSQICETVEGIEHMAQETPHLIPGVTTMLDAWLGIDACDWAP